MCFSLVNTSILTLCLFWNLYFNLLSLNIQISFITTIEIKDKTQNTYMYNYDFCNDLKT
jgi:hypothetical protein